ncbi:hypothetical protein HDU76_009636 [Blyttiomyces sp. JEL0837]|nr:hypothetical protein HDU76_009636 [Blyttiomyces sp. JEL0837]
MPPYFTSNNTNDTTTTTITTTTTTNTISPSSSSSPKRSTINMQSPTSTTTTVLPPPMISTIPPFVPTSNNKKSLSRRGSSWTGSSSAAHANSCIQFYTFKWQHRADGKDVILTGSFDDWKGGLHMNHITIEEDEYELTIPVDRSQDIQFKFIINGVWRCGSLYPTVDDGKGNVNNVLPALSEFKNGSSGSSDDSCGSSLGSRSPVDSVMSP